MDDGPCLYKCLAALSKQRLQQHSLFAVQEESCTVSLITGCALQQACKAQAHRAHHSEGLRRKAHAMQSVQIQHHLSLQFVHGRIAFRLFRCVPHSSMNLTCTIIVHVFLDKLLTNSKYKHVYMYMRRT